MTGARDSFCYAHRFNHIDYGWAQFLRSRVARHLMEKEPKEIRILSRDEKKQGHAATIPRF